MKVAFRRVLSLFYYRFSRQSERSKSINKDDAKPLTLREHIGRQIASRSKKLRIAFDQQSHRRSCDRMTLSDNPLHVPLRSRPIFFSIELDKTTASLLDQNLFSSTWQPRVLCLTPEIFRLGLHISLGFRLILLFGLQRSFRGRIVGLGRDI